MAAPELVIEGRDITRDYTLRAGLFGTSRTIHAVKGVSFAVERGKTLAIVGESGCGKSTLARIITLIDPATSGTLLIEGKPVDIAHQRMTKALRATVQIVFQNPYGSLNPRPEGGRHADGIVDSEHRRARPGAARTGDGDADVRSVCCPNISTAIRICSRAASGNGLRLPAR